MSICTLEKKKPFNFFLKSGCERGGKHVAKGLEPVTAARRSEALSVPHFTPAPLPHTPLNVLQAIASHVCTFSFSFIKS